jgi:UDP-N-acetylmuramate dehydrogenase
MTKFQLLQKKLGSHVKENELLSKHTTFKIGGPARYFFAAKNKKDIVNAIKTSKKLSIPYCILSGGSNVLVSDQGFPGLVIKIQNTKYEIRDTKIIADAGASLSTLIQATTKKSLSGLEYFIGLPGTLGGAIYGNAGWPKGKHTIGDQISKVELLYPNGDIKKVKKKWMKFSYRHSRLSDFKISERPIILSATLKLKSENPSEIQERIKEIVLVRAKKVPKGNSAGCIFKNFEFANMHELPANLRELIPNKFIPQKTIPAGWLIEQCGLKGKILGGAKISEQHANFIINFNRAKSRDVLKLMKLAQSRVYKKFKIKLREETQYMG